MFGVLANEKESVNKYMYIKISLTLISGGQVTIFVTIPPCTANVWTIFPLYKSHSLTEKSAPPDNK